MEMKKLFSKLIITLLICLLFLFIGLILASCAKQVEYKDVYIPQKCQVELPPKLNCSSVSSTDYEAITHCMIWNKKRQELLEARLKFCIGDDL